MVSILRIFNSYFYGRLRNSLYKVASFDVLLWNYYKCIYLQLSMNWKQLLGYGALHQVKHHFRRAACTCYNMLDIVHIFVILQVILFPISQNAAKRQLVAPSFIDRVVNETVRENEAVTLTCKVSGCPTPHVSWQRDQKHIMPNAGGYRYVGITLIIEFLKKSMRAFTSHFSNGRSLKWGIA